MSYYRRSFDSSLCPKHPPKKEGRAQWGSSIGSPFNMWFKKTLSENNIKTVQFAELIDEHYQTVYSWRSKSDPVTWGMCRIARGFEALGLGEYEDIKQTIKDLKKRRKG